MKRLTDLLDLAGLGLLGAAAFELSTWLGLAVSGAACLVASRGLTARRKARTP